MQHDDERISIYMDICSSPIYCVGEVGLQDFSEIVRCRYSKLDRPVVAVAVSVAQDVSRYKCMCKKEKERDRQRDRQTEH